MEKVRKPKVTEVEGIKKLIDDAVKQGHVLPRELHELFENVRDFYVAVAPSGDIVGCVALHIDTIELAEVRSLVVRQDLRGHGIGERLVDAVLREAQNLDIARVYALTRVVPFFTRNGFHIVDKTELPYKVFKDCLRCRLFPGCDEVAVVVDLPHREELALAGASAAGAAALHE